MKEKKKKLDDEGSKSVDDKENETTICLDTSSSQDEECHDAYKCDTCPAIFITRKAAINHMSNEHDDEDSVTESVDNDDVTKEETVITEDDSTEQTVDDENLQEDVSSDDETNLSKTVKDQIASIIQDWD